jgi:hypothetical protein
MLGFGILLGFMVLNASYRRQLERIREYGKEIAK